MNRYMIVLLACLISPNMLLFGQTFDLDFELISVTPSDYQVKIKIRGSAAFELGSANIRFNFNNTDLQNPRLVSAHNFDLNPYTPMTVTESVVGVASINITNISQNGTVVAVDPNWTDMATVGFTVTDPSGYSNLAFRSTTASNPATVVFKVNPTAQLTSNQLGVLNTTPLPVELISFSAYNRDDYVHLHWETATELNNYGFEVQREEEGCAWETVAFVPGHGTVHYPQIYDYDDQLAGLAIPIVQQRQLRYRLKQVDRDGSFEYSPVVDVAFTSAPGRMSIEVYPNPSTDRAAVSLRIDEESPVDIAVYDMTGREVLQLASGQLLGRGTHTFTIPTRSLTEGVYALHVRSGSGISTRTFVVGR